MRDNGSNHKLPPEILETTQNFDQEDDISSSQQEFFDAVDDTLEVDGDVFFDANTGLEYDYESVRKLLGFEQNNFLVEGTQKIKKPSKGYSFTPSKVMIFLGVLAHSARVTGANFLRQEPPQPPLRTQSQNNSDFSDDSITQQIIKTISAPLPPSDLKYQSGLYEIANQSYLTDLNTTQSYGSLRGSHLTPFVNLTDFNSSSLEYRTDYNKNAEVGTESVEQYKDDFEQFISEWQSFKGSRGKSARRFSIDSNGDFFVDYKYKNGTTETQKIDLGYIGEWEGELDGDRPLSRLLRDKDGNSYEQFRNAKGELSFGAIDWKYKSKWQNYGFDDESQITGIRNLSDEYEDFEEIRYRNGTVTIRRQLIGDDAIPATAVPTRAPTRQPTPLLTQSPSQIPTRQPSVSPTVNPTINPTFNPTVNPTTANPSSRPSSQPSGQPSSQPVARPSSLPSSSPSGVPTFIPSSRPSSRPSRQPSSQPTRQPSNAPTTQPTKQPTAQPISKPTSQPSGQPTVQPSLLPSGQPNAQPTTWPTSQPTRRPFSQPTSQPSQRPSINPSSRPTRQPTSRPSLQPSAQPSSHPSNQPTSQPTVRPSQVPTAQPSGQPSASPTAQPSVVPTRVPTSQPTSWPTSSSSSNPTSQPTSSPSTKPTVQPSTLPTVQPSSEPTVQPTDYPSLTPTGQPTRRPSAVPTRNPIALPTSYPSGQPSRSPTSQPSTQPSGQPSGKPSVQPTTRPSNVPTQSPSAQPTTEPSLQPVGLPTSLPSTTPSSQPTVVPSRRSFSQPTSSPSNQPSSQPSSNPSSRPTQKPSDQPTGKPSGQPSGEPTGQPSEQPSNQPSSLPTALPTAQPIPHPTSQPSTQPSTEPSAQPVANPSAQPSASPTVQPSSFPTSLPTDHPSTSPTTTPSNAPQAAPTVSPSIDPTAEPTAFPSVYIENGEIHPSPQPTSQPTGQPKSQPSFITLDSSGKPIWTETQTVITAGTVGGVSLLAISAYIYKLQRDRKNAVDDLRNLSRAVEPDINIVEEDPALEAIMAEPPAVIVEPKPIILHDKARNLVLKFRDEKQFRFYGSHMRFRAEFESAVSELAARELQSAVTAEDQELAEGTETNAKWLKDYLNAIEAAAKASNGDEVRRLISDAAAKTRLTELLDRIKISGNDRTKFLDFLESFISPQKGADFYGKYYEEAPQILEIGNGFNINGADELFLFENFRAISAEEVVAAGQEFTTEDGARYTYDIAHCEEYYSLEADNSLIKKPVPIYVIGQDGNLLVFKRDKDVQAYLDFLDYPKSIQRMLEDDEIDAEVDIAQVFTDYLQDFSDTCLAKNDDEIGALLLDSRLQTIFAAAKMDEAAQEKFMLYLAHIQNPDSNIAYQKFCGQTAPRVIDKDSGLFSVSRDGAISFYENYRPFDRQKYSINAERTEITYFDDEGKELKESNFFIDKNGQTIVYDVYQARGYSWINESLELEYIEYHEAEAAYYFDLNDDLLRFADETHMESYQNLEDFMRSLSAAEIEQLRQYQVSGVPTAEVQVETQENVEPFGDLTLQDIENDKANPDALERQKELETIGRDTERLAFLLDVVDRKKALTDYFAKYCGATADILEEENEYRFKDGNLIIYQNFRDLDPQLHQKADPQTSFIDQKTGKVKLYDTVEIGGYFMRDDDGQSQFYEYREPEMVYLVDSNHRMLRFDCKSDLDNYQLYLHYKQNFIDLVKSEDAEKAQWLEGYFGRIAAVAKDKTAIAAITQDAESAAKLEEIFDLIELNLNGRKQFNDYVNAVVGKIDNLNAFYREYFGNPATVLGRSMYHLEDGNLVLHEYLPPEQQTADKKRNSQFAEGHYVQQANGSLEYFEFRQHSPVFFVTAERKVLKFRSNSALERYQEHFNYAANLIQRVRAESPEDADNLKRLIDATMESQAEMVGDEEVIARTAEILKLDQDDLDQLRDFLYALANPQTNNEYYERYYGDAPDVLELGLHCGFENGNLVTYHNVRDLDAESRDNENTRRFIDREAEKIVLYDALEEQGYFYQRDNGTIDYKEYQRPEKVYLLGNNQEELLEFIGPDQLEQYKQFLDYVPQLFRTIQERSPEAAKRFEELLTDGGNSRTDEERQSLLQDQRLQEVMDLLEMDNFDKTKLRFYFFSLTNPNSTSEFYKTYYGKIPAQLSRGLDFEIDEDYRLLIHENATEFNDEIHRFDVEANKVFLRAAEGEAEIEVDFITKGNGEIIVCDKRPVVRYFEKVDEHTIEDVFSVERKAQEFARITIESFLEKTEQVEDNYERILDDTITEISSEIATEVLQQIYNENLENLREQEIQRIRQASQQILEELIESAADETDRNIAQEVLKNIIAQIHVQETAATAAEISEDALKTAQDTISAGAVSAVGNLAHESSDDPIERANRIIEEMAEKYHETMRRSHDMAIVLIEGTIDDFIQRLEYENEAFEAIDDHNSAQNSQYGDDDFEVIEEEHKEGFGEQYVEEQKETLMSRTQVIQGSEPLASPDRERPKTAQEIAKERVARYRSRKGDNSEQDRSRRERSNSKRPQTTEGQKEAYDRIREWNKRNSQTSEMNTDFSMIALDGTFRSPKNLNETSIDDTLTGIEITVDQPQVKLDQTSMIPVVGRNPSNAAKVYEHDAYWRREHAERLRQQLNSRISERARTRERLIQSATIVNESSLVSGVRQQLNRVKKAYGGSVALSSLTLSEQESALSNPSVQSINLGEESIAEASQLGFIPLAPLAEEEEIKESELRNTEAPAPTASVRQSIALSGGRGGKGRGGHSENRAKPQGKKY